MIIAGNDEAKRSKIWRVVTLVSSVLIILIAVYLLTRMFTTNPVVGNWESEDATIALKIEKNDSGRYHGYCGEYRCNRRDELQRRYEVKDYYYHKR